MADFSKTEIETEAMKHLGEVLYAISDMQEKYRSKALEQALIFYNENAGDSFNRIFWDDDPMIAALDEE